MTSRISFSKLVRMEFRQQIWLAALQGLLYTLLLPFPALLGMSSELGTMANRGDRIDHFIWWASFSRDMGGLLALAAGVICALCAFAYLYSQTKVDLYHSLPVKRGQLFGAKYAASVLTFVLPFVAAQLLVLVVGLGYNGVTGAMAMEMAVLLVQQILFFLCSYSAVLVAVMLTGKLLTTICAVLVFFGYVPLFLLLAQAFADEFLYTAVGFSNMWSLNKATLKYSSPWAFCIFWGQGSGIENGRVGLTGSLPSVAGLCQLVALIVLLSLLSLALYRRRRSEVAGEALAFRKLEPVIKILLALPAALIAAIVALETFESSVWAVVFILLFGALACMLMEFIYRWDIRQSLHHWQHILFTAVAALAIFLGFRFDVFGYNSYLPDQDELQGMAVNSAWMGNRAILPGKETMSNQEWLDYLETDQVDIVYGLAENGVEIGDEGCLDDTIVKKIYVKYHLKNGKEVYRYYTVDEELYFDAMEKLCQDMECREKYLPVLQYTEDMVYRIYKTLYPNEIPVLYSSGDTGVEEDESNTGESELPETEDETSTENDTETGIGTSGEGDSGTFMENLVDTVMTVSGRLTGDAPLEIEVPRERIGEVLSAYQKDLRELPYRTIENAGSYLEMTLLVGHNTFQWSSSPLDGSFTNTIGLLLEIATESGL